ncbi:mucin-17-like [Condylostylus longicornis]|uniref:mucin-17-like n=1 Tax=Condylostylus longicornis TaxID=2530218 RepID=UPI00244D9BD6|nr:mucin-17-like [Condylostylus longicornis]
MLLTFSILIFSFFVIEGFPAQETSIPPKPIIESGVYRQALDSYGNPVAYLEAADAPDGRKFVHAGEGVQFEIPKYASGITEIKKPDSNLLPPLDGGSINEQSTNDEEENVKVLQADVVTNQKIENTDSTQQKSQYPLKVQLNLQSISQPNILQAKAIESPSKKLITDANVLANTNTGSIDLRNNEHFSQLERYFEINPNLIPLSIVPSVELNVSPLVAPPFLNTDIEFDVNNPFEVEKHESPNQVKNHNRFEKDAAAFDVVTVAPKFSAEMTEKLSQLNLNPLVPPKTEFNETLTFEISQNYPVQSLNINPFLPAAENFFTHRDKDESSTNVPEINNMETVKGISELNLDPLIPPRVQETDESIPNDFSNTQTELANAHETGESSPVELPATSKSVESIHNKITTEAIEKSPTFPAKSVSKPERVISTTKMTATRTATNKANAKLANKNTARNLNRRPQVISKFSISTVPKNFIPSEKTTSHLTLPKAVSRNIHNNNKSDPQISANPTTHFQNVSHVPLEKNEPQYFIENDETLSILNLEPLIPPEVTYSSEYESLTEGVNNTKIMFFKTQPRSDEFSFNHTLSTLDFEIPVNSQIQSTSAPDLKYKNDIEINAAKKDGDRNVSPGAQKESKIDGRNKLSKINNMKVNIGTLSTTASLKHQPKPETVAYDAEDPNLFGKVLNSETEDLNNNKKIHNEEIQLKLNLQPLIPPIQDKFDELEFDEPVSRDKVEPESKLQLNDTFTKPLETFAMNVEPFIPSRVETSSTDNLHITYTESTSEKTIEETTSKPNENKPVDYKENITESLSYNIEATSPRGNSSYYAMSNTSSLDRFHMKMENIFALNTDPLIPPAANLDPGIIDESISGPSAVTAAKTLKNERVSKFQNSPIINIVLDKSFINVGHRANTLNSISLTESRVTTTPKHVAYKNIENSSEKSSSMCSAYGCTTPSLIATKEFVSNTEMPPQTTTLISSNNPPTIYTKPSPTQHSILLLPKNLTPNTVKPEISSSTIANSNSNSKPLPQIFNTEFDQITITTSPTTTTSSTFTTSANSISNSITNSISSNFEFFTAAPPSKLFIPPVLDQKQYSIADSTIDSTSSTFSSAPATSFAERLNFNKNQDQKEVIQDLLPPIETPINQIAAGQVQKAEANPPPFSSNPFLTKTAGLSAPKQQVSSGGIRTFGGAPGFLGNQKPGYAIRPSSGSSGTIINPSPTPASGQSAFNKQPTIDNRFAEKGNHPGKYSGGFGGPPGILAPYDNVKQ